MKDGDKDEWSRRQRFRQNLVEVRRPSVMSGGGGRSGLISGHVASRIIVGSEAKLRSQVRRNITVGVRTVEHTEGRQTFWREIDESSDRAKSDCDADG
jgi:hypothetical protein